MAHDAFELSEFFSGADYDLKEKVLLELCKRDPDTLLDIIRTVDQNIGIDEIKSLMRSGQRVAAVKRMREMVPGMGLKEAVNYVDRLPL